MNLGKGYKEEPFQYIATGFKLFRSPNCPNFLLYFKLYPKMSCYNNTAFSEPNKLNVAMDFGCYVKRFSRNSRCFRSFWSKFLYFGQNMNHFWGILWYSVVQLLSQLHKCIQQKLTSVSAQVQTLLTACWRFAIMRTTDKCLSLVNLNIKQFIYFSIWCFRVLIEVLSGFYQQNHVKTNSDTC